MGLAKHHANAENSPMSKFQLDPSHPPPLPEALEESHRVILGLWEVIAGLKARLDELEEQLNTGSDNSSVPPPKIARRSGLKGKGNLRQEGAKAPSLAIRNMSVFWFRRAKWTRLPITM